MKKSILIIIFAFALNMLIARLVVMLTGYWAPTSEMLQRFSTDPVLNPEGWIGEDWEDRGYDVYAFFPAFDPTTREFEVDYQATWEDFWARTEEYHPEIIISFGAGAGPWEIETKALNRNSWYADDVAPFYPTPNPPDDTVPANTARYATLPVQNIRHAVNEQTNINAWVDTNGDPGDFLCAYLAYLGMWYQNMHESEDDEFYCKAAGFIHVDADLNLDDCTVAAEVSLRATLEYYENLADLPGSIIAEEPIPNCLITLTDSFFNVYEATSDENGDFIFEDLLFGEYTVSVNFGRYYYYDEVFVFDSHDDYLLIEPEDFSLTDPLTYSQGANELISSDVGAFVFTAAYFPPELLIPYTDCHLNSFLFTAPEDSDNCASALFLYRGNPMEDNLSLVFSITLPEFEQGELVEVMRNEIYFLTDEDLQDGLTMAFGINSPNNNIGYSDNTVANPNGNLILVNSEWCNADEELGIEGNWDLQLGFYGEPSVAINNEELIINNYKLSNYPNPFNPSTTISFNLTTEHAESTEIQIYNVKGRLVGSIPIYSSTHSPINSVTWDATQFSSGVYFYKLVSDGKTLETKKMLMIK